MKHQANPTYSAQIYQEACEWFVEFRSGQPEEPARRAFQAWLQVSPVHMGAYLDVAGNWHRTGSADLARLGSIEELVAYASQDSAVVVAHPSATGISPGTPAGTSRGTGSAVPPRGRGFALAACLGAGLMVAGLIGWWTHAPTYSTDIGEQHSIVLRDGSTVNLNSRSRIRIRYSGRERAVDLLEGQALFTVAKDATRPFIVIAGSTQVRAVGTEFDVYCKATGTVVTVVEGRVAVLARSKDSSDNAGRSVRIQSPASHDKANEEAGADVAGVSFLSAGEQLVVTPRAAASPVPANVAAATAWTQRQLIFDSTPLNEVAAEFNRYNERQFVIRDPGLNTFQIDGVFSSTDPTSLIRFLRARPDMKVTETDSEIVIAHR